MYVEGMCVFIYCLSYIRGMLGVVVGLFQKPSQYHMMHVYHPSLMYARGSVVHVILYVFYLYGSFA